MNNFNDFNIVTQVKKFIGDKIPIKKVLNQTISILDYKVEPSKLKEGTECLHLQIEKSGEKRIIFTGSKNMIEQIKQVPGGKFPFTTVIKENDYYEFT